MTDSPYELAQARLFAARLPATIKDSISNLIDSVFDGEEDDLALRSEIISTVSRYWSRRMRIRVEGYVSLIPLDAIRAEGKADRAKEGGAA